MNIEYLAEILDDTLDEEDNAPFPIVVNNNNNSQLTWLTRVYAQTSVKKMKYLDELYERSQIPQCKVKVCWWIQKMKQSNCDLIINNSLWVM